jgi:hypothetical protein
MKASSRSINPAVAFVATALAAIGLLGPNRAQAQSSIPRDETWVTNGTVYAIARTPDTVYIGGTFTYVGPCTGSGVPISADTGELVAPFPKVNGAVLASVPDGAGGWFIGGEFTNVGGLARNYIAHILPNGLVDSGWDPNARGGFPETYVYALAVSGSTVYVGGYFTRIGGQARNYIAALDTGTGQATDWNPNASGGFGMYPGVYALAISGSTVYVGGLFGSIGGQSRNWIAALDAATGQATAWNPNASGGDTFYCGVYALAISGSTVYAGGTFTTIGGQTRNNIAALA